MISQPVLIESLCFVKSLSLGLLQPYHGLGLRVLLKDCILNLQHCPHKVVAGYLLNLPFTLLGLSKLALCYHKQRGFFLDAAIDTWDPVADW